jgi:tryptophanyl-tRNA synthetase
MKKILVSGIKPTGKPHLGNYAGMLKPALDLSKEKANACYYFIPDVHALNSIQNPKVLKELVYEVAATYLALGLNPAHTFFYKQSDIPEIFQLSQILSCVCPKGFMNRAHAYKAAIDENIKSGEKDQDAGINMGLYTYPILMAADILAFDADIVPVGQDQKQHVEYARDIAIKFNNVFGKVFSVPDIKIRPDVPILPGVDGRKMSKSYNNTVPLFAEPSQIKKIIFKIKTDSKKPGEPKDYSESLIFSYYTELSTDQEIETFRKAFEEGISYADAKTILFEKMEKHFYESKLKFDEFMNNTDVLDSILCEGANKARQRAKAVIDKVRDAAGL